MQQALISEFYYKIKLNEVADGERSSRAISIDRLTIMNDHEGRDEWRLVTKLEGLDLAKP